MDMEKAGMIRGQPALEFLTTYSWAILILTIFLAAAVIISLPSNNNSYLPSSCSIQPLLPCEDTLLVSNLTYYVTFINNLQSPMFFPNDSFNVTTTGLGVQGTQRSAGNCYPAFAMPGDPIICKDQIPGTLIPPIGSRVSTSFTLGYLLCQNGMYSSCGSALYKSSGIGEQSIAPANVPFVLLNISILAPLEGNVNGTIYLNGVPYVNGPNIQGQQLLLVPGKYQLYGTPPGGFNFHIWNITGPGTITSPSSQNTVLSFSASANVIFYTTSWYCSSTACWGGVFVHPIDGCPARCSVISSSLPLCIGASYHCVS